MPEGAAGPAASAAARPRLIVAVTREQDWASECWASVGRLVQVARGAGADVMVAVCGEGSTGLPGGFRACPGPAALLKLVEEELRTAGTVVRSLATLILTDDAAFAERAAAPGCLAIVMEPPPRPWPAQGTHLVVDDARRLVPYFERPPAALLELLRSTASEIQARHDVASARFARAVAHGGRVFVFGAGTIGRQVARTLRDAQVLPAGFLDNDPARWDRQVDGIEVQGPMVVDPSRDLVVVAVGRHAVTIEHQLDSMGVRHRFNLSELLFHLGERPERDLAGELAANALHYHALYTLLRDAESRRTLDAVVAHRLTLNTGALAAVCVHDAPQWFDEHVVPDRDDYVLVDGGAYDGDTVASFAAAYDARFGGVYAFEPDPELAGRAAERFRGDPRVRVYACGLSDRTTRATFAITGATNGRLGEAQTEAHSERGKSVPDARADHLVVDVASIDEVIRESVSFIKLDVEGEELPVLRGAVRHITSDAPLLAIAAYHRAADMWEIPQYILSLSHDYRLFLRHYTEVSFETVLYAVPASTAASGAS
jgi:FkbM family methyltransferase